MGVTNFLVLLSGLLGVSFAFFCPESDGLFQHETRCDMYYWCVNNVAHVSHCPPGSFFSTVTNFCNWPYAVTGCTEHGARTDAGWSQPEPESPPERSQHLNSWERDSNRWSQQNWDTFMAKALKGAMAKVKSERTKREVKAVAYQGLGVCNGDDGYFRHKEDCTLYWWCIQGVPRIQSCQGGLFFDPAIERCSWAKGLYDCDSEGKRLQPFKSKSSHALSRTTRSVVSGYQCPNSYGYFRHPTTCHQYVWCVESVPRLMECQGDNRFDIVIKRCNMRWKVPDCDKNNRRTHPETTPFIAAPRSLSRRKRAPRIVEGFQCPNSYGYFRHPTSCSLYVRCVDGQPREKQCEGNKYFDKKINFCNRPWFVDGCDESGRRIPERSPMRSLDLRAQISAQRAHLRRRRSPVIVRGYQCPNSYGYFRHPTSCSLYVRCVDGQPREKQCEGNKYFDKKINFCNRPWFVDGCDESGRRTEPERTPLRSLNVHPKISTYNHLGVYPPTTADIEDEPEISCDRNEDGLWGDPVDCSIYYHCNKGVGTKFTCSPGTFFNPKTLVCSWPGEVSDCNADGTVKEMFFRKKRDVNEDNDDQHIPLTPADVPVPEIYDCPEIDGYYPHDVKCEMYFRCVNRKSTQFMCTPGTYFNPRTSTCTWPHEVIDCDSEGTRQPAFRKKRSIYTDGPRDWWPYPDYPSQKEKYDCPPVDGFYRHDTNCSVYFRCMKGESTRFVCNGTFYNPSITSCSWPEEVPDCNPDGTRKHVLKKRHVSVPGQNDDNEDEHIPLTPADVPVPEIYDCPEMDGYYPHDVKCEMYFRCVNRKSTQFMCTPGTYFNPRTSTCTWPQEVIDCDSEGTRQPAYRKKRSVYSDGPKRWWPYPDYPSQKEKYDCPPVDGFYRHDTNCSVYFRCMKGESTRFVCNGTFYNPSITSCSWPEEVPDCNPDGTRKHVLKKRHVSAPGQKDDNEAAHFQLTPADVPVPEIYDCPETDGYYPHDVKCEMYFRCVNRKSTQFMCTPGTYFNPRTSTCTWPHEVIDCNSDGTRQPAYRKKRSVYSDGPKRWWPYPDYPSQKEKYDCPPVDGFYRHDTNCSVYFRCMKGESTRFVCNGTFYNPSITSCSWPEEVPDCNPDGTRKHVLKKRHVSTPGQNHDDEDSHIPLTPADVPVPEIYDCPEIDGYYPHDVKCEMYFRCVNRKSTHFMCTPGTYFNPRTSTCTWPEEVIECDSEGTRQPAFRKRRSPRDWWPYPEWPSQKEKYDCPPVDGFYRHKTNCSVYFRCIKGESTRFVCNATFYNPRNMGCSWPEEVLDCNADGTRKHVVRKRRSIFSAPGQKDGPSYDRKQFRCPLMDGYYRDDTDCKVYYWCVSQKSTKYACANGTFFNPKMKLCTWPSQVYDCDQEGARISHSPYQSRVREFSCPAEDGYYRHPIDCATYFRCNDRKLTVYKCTPGTVFDPRNKVCSWPAQVPDCNEHGEVMSSPFKGHSAAKANTTKIENKSESSSTESTRNVTEPVSTTTVQKTFQTTPGSTTQAPLTTKKSSDTTKKSPVTTQKSPVGIRHIKIKGQSTMKPASPSTESPKVKKANSSSTTTVTIKVKKENSSTRNATNVPGLPKANDGFGHSGKAGEVYTFGTADTSGFQCPQAEGYFSDMDDCASYFHCEHGVAYKRECGPGDFYSPLSQTCIPGELVPDCNYDDSLEAETYPEWTKDYYKSYVSDFDCPDLHGYFADEKDCSSYLECINGNAYARKCNEGTYFDEAKQKCTWEVNNDSCSKVKSGPTPDTIGDLLNSGPFVCPSREGYFRDPKTCTMFYECHEGVPKSRACGPDTLFDDKKKKCTWPELVTDCDLYGRVISSDETVFSGKEPHQMEKNPNGFACPLPSGHFRDPRDCAVFYHCVKNVAYKGRCRGRHVFDLESLKCLDPEMVPGCDVAPTVPLIEKPTEEASAFACTSDGYFKDQTDCTAYYSCKDGVYFRHHCKPGTVFSESKKLCTWPHLVPGCEGSDDVQPPHNDVQPESMSEVAPPTEEPAVDDSSTEESTLSVETTADDSDSSDSAGGETSMTESTDSGSEDDIIPESGGEAMSDTTGSKDDLINMMQGETGFICPEVFDGFYGDPVYCQKFHRCVNKKKYSFTCPAGTFFDTGRHICNFKEKVPGCTFLGLRISQPGNDAPEKAPAVVPIAPIVTPEPMPMCPESDGLFPHPSSCSKFLYCARYTPMVLTCPKDLVYNMDKKTCDYSENVVCIRYD